MRRVSPSNVSDIWAVLTIAAFPIVMAAATRFGASFAMSFFLGMLGSIAVLVVDGVTEPRLWMFETKWREKFESTDFSFRLAVISGAVLLILETSLFVVFFLDGSLDRSMFSLILGRQCQHPVSGFQDICRLFSIPPIR